MQISERTKSLGTENAFVVLAEVKKLISEGKDIVNFCIGEPDFDTPDNIKDAAITALKNGKTKYTPSAGINDLRKVAAKYLSEARNIEINLDEVVIGNGAKIFIMLAVLLATDAGKGDEVLFPNPGFPIYSSIIKAMGAVPVALPLFEENNFNFDINDLARKINKNSRLLILNSPQNPTGAVLSREELELIARLVRPYDTWIFSDEVYSKMVHDGKFVSIASIPGMRERTIIVDGCSKTYAMTGWRIGFAGCPNASVARCFERWITNITSCANSIAQVASVEALSGPQEESQDMMQTFAWRRDLIVNGLNQIIGIKCLKPGGAFYVWPNVTEACGIVGAQDSEEFRKMLLYEAGVAVLADIHFGPRVPDEGQHIRFSYATSEKNIVEGLERIKKYVEGRIIRPYGGRDC